MVAGILGWMRKRKRREDQGQGFYRGAASTLKQRMRKRLLDPVNWYKNKKEDNTEEEEPERKEERAPTTLKRKKRSQRLTI